jgi:hypothetical protein
LSFSSVAINGFTSDFLPWLVVDEECTGTSVVECKWGEYLFNVENDLQNYSFSFVSLIKQYYRQ